MHRYDEASVRAARYGGGLDLTTTERKDVGAIVHFKDGFIGETRAKTFKELCHLIDTR